MSPLVWADPLDPFSTSRLESPVTCPGSEPSLEKGASFSQKERPSNAVSLHQLRHLGEEGQFSQLAQWVREGNLSALKLTFQAHPNWRTLRDAEGHYLTHVAAKEGQKKILNLLLEKKEFFPPEKWLAENQEGETIFDLAPPKLKAFLIKKFSKNGEASFHEAWKAQYKADALRTLDEKESSLNLKSCAGLTDSQKACEEKLYKTMLLEFLKPRFSRYQDRAYLEGGKSPVSAEYELWLFSEFKKDLRTVLRERHQVASSETKTPIPLTWIDEAMREAEFLENRDHAIQQKKEAFRNLLNQWDAVVQEWKDYKTILQAAGDHQRKWVVIDPKRKEEFAAWKNSHPKVLDPERGFFLEKINSINLSLAGFRGRLENLLSIKIPELEPKNLSKEDFLKTKEYLIELLQLELEKKKGKDLFQP